MHKNIFLLIIVLGVRIMSTAQAPGSDGDLVKVSPAPSKTQKEYNELNKALQRVEERWKIVMDTLNKVNKRSNVAFQELKGWVLIPYFKEIEEVNLSFFNKYPYSFVTAYALQFVARDLTTDSVKLFYNRFPEQVKKSIYGKYIQNEIEKRKLGAVGKMAAGFSKPDINGNTVDLSKLLGKYVLLDFWGSWCVPCRKGNPHLIETYAKYKHLGLEIIGIAADDETPDAWRKAVVDDKLPWLHVLRGDTPETNLSIKYNIDYYPTKILIDKSGKIIGRYGEETEALDKMLESIFK
jgi:thiol-disulfide isomerase/thioredoxin